MAGQACRTQALLYRPGQYKGKVETKNYKDYLKIINNFPLKVFFFF